MNGILPKQIFEPNHLVSRYEFVTVVSRVIYGGKYNVALTSKTPWYQNHLTKITQDGLMVKPAIVMQSFVLNILSIIQKNP
jgi:hypothetical protein